MDSTLRTLKKIVGNQKVSALIQYYRFMKTAVIECGSVRGVADLIAITRRQKTLHITFLPLQILRAYQTPTCMALLKTSLPIKFLRPPTMGLMFLPTRKREYLKNISTKYICLIMSAGQYF